MANPYQQAINRRFRRRPLPNNKPGIRKSRNSIPKVNENPQPPGATSMAMMQRVGNSPNPGNQTTQPTQPTSTTSRPGNQGSTTNNQRPPSSASGASTSYVPRPGQPDPRDDQYWRDLTRLKLDRNFQTQNMDLESTFSKSSYEQALEKLAIQEPRDIQSTRESANQAGGFYSSRTGEDIGRLQQEYFGQRSDLGRNFNYDNAKRALERDLVESGYNIDEAQSLADAVARLSANEMDRPAPYVAAMESRLGTSSGGSSRKKSSSRNSKKKRSSSGNRSARPSSSGRQAKKPGNRKKR